MFNLKLYVAIFVHLFYLKNTYAIYLFLLNIYVMYSIMFEKTSNSLNKNSGFKSEVMLWNSNFVY